MEDEMKFEISEDGTFKVYEEPYATIECKTKGDYEKFVGLLEDNKKLRRDKQDLECELDKCIDEIRILRSNANLY